MKYLTPLFLLGISIAAFFVYIDPTYTKVKSLKAEAAEYDQALNNSKQLQAVRDELLSKYNTLSPSSITRLEKLLPDNVDNVRLVLDIDGVASKYGLVIRNVVVEDAKPVGDLGPEQSKYQSIVLRFSVTANYANFTQFIEDLERSLRIVDVKDVSFTASEADFNEYSVGLNTYWLK